MQTQEEQREANNKIGTEALARIEGDRASRDVRNTLEAHLKAAGLPKFGSSEVKGDRISYTVSFNDPSDYDKFVAHLKSFGR